MDVSKGAFDVPANVQVTGDAALPSAFDVTGLAVASMAEAATAIAQLATHHGAPSADI